ncbi:PREDICTED: snRNA-activating protein complex subunit 2 [Nanorana parkeri]|uniref:snRNA-activating protein complex subunit 2 n=1 Tax=Nanorana parkeri TaxID=125878 RepID=UPI000854A5B1|nr:PREDICTED: snRNA-activating protein complex subunit 2 [Nanorana parkeri]
MKPPVRRRTAPVRFEVLDTQPVRSAPIRLAWTTREKVELLRGLKAQMDQKVPDPPVQGRSQLEVSSYIAWLRGRAAREAVQTIYEEWVQERKAQEAETPAPIELWTDLVCRMSSPAEEAVTAAFSQMLTIASTEPGTLRHSIPSKEPRKRASRSSSAAKKSLQLKVASGEEPGASGKEPGASGKEPGASGKGPDASGEEPGASGKEPDASEEVPAPLEERSTPLGEKPAPSEEEPAAVESANDRWKKLEFDKIYKYLSKAATGEALPKLSECESAVVLHLLHCIPDQLQTLDAKPLGVYLRKTYAYVDSPAKSESSEQEETSSDSQTVNQNELGFCPLNPFLLPLELLKSKEKKVAPS